MNLVSRRQIGTTDLHIPVLGLGTCPLGGVYRHVPEDTARATFEEAWNQGLRLYDTAPWYGLGQAEHRTGRALYEQPRNDFVLTTKVGRVLKAPSNRSAFKTANWAGALQFEHRHSFTYDAIMRSYEDSLQRLGINRVDALYIHDLDHGYFPTEQLLNDRLNELRAGGYRALEDLKRNGEIKAVGAGINERGMINRFLDAFDMDVFLVASRYTLLEQDIYLDEVPNARKHGASLVVGGVFNSGILATGAVSDAKYEYGAAPLHVIDRVRRLSAVAQSHHVDLAAAALQFPLAAPEVSAVVFGAVTPAEIQTNCRHFSASIPESFWSDLRAEGLIHPAVPLPADDKANDRP